MAPQKQQLCDGDQTPKRHKHSPSLFEEYLLQQQRQANIKMVSQQQQQQPIKVKTMLNHNQTNSFNEQIHRHQQQTNNSGLLNVDDSTTTAAFGSSIGQVQKKLLAFFYCYAILVVTMFLAYAIFCYHQQSVAKQYLNKQASSDSSYSLLNPTQAVASSQIGEDPLQTAESQQHEQLVAKLESKLENKILLLERYIEVIALDLEETKTRLREREKCSCSIGCTFNGTKFNDNQTWQQKCDTCSCRAGKITCAPRKCPPTNCDDPIQVPGQCCPVCMKKCKLQNKTLIKHGHTFKPTSDSSKQCTCQNGLIKCEKIQQKSAAQEQQNTKAIQPTSATIPQISQQQQHSSNKTVSEYLKLISTTNLKLASSNNNGKSNEPVREETKTAGH